MSENVLHSVLLIKKQLSINTYTFTHTHAHPCVLKHAYCTVTFLFIESNWNRRKYPNSQPPKNKQNPPTSQKPQKATCYADEAQHTWAGHPGTICLIRPTDPSPLLHGPCPLRSHALQPPDPCNLVALPWEWRSACPPSQGPLVGRHQEQGRCHQKSLTVSRGWGLEHYSPSVLCHASLPCCLLQAED